jgi:putative transposase
VPRALCGNALAHVSPTQHQMVAAVIRTPFAQESRDDAVAQWRETADRLRERFLKPGDLTDDAEADGLAFMTFPKEHWRQTSSTNPLKRINKEIKRRTSVVGIVNRIPGSESSTPPPRTSPTGPEYPRSRAEAF